MSIYMHMGDPDLRGFCYLLLSKPCVPACAVGATPRTRRPERLSRFSQRWRLAGLATNSGSLKVCTWEGTVLPMVDDPYARVDSDTLFWLRIGFLRWGVAVKFRSLEEGSPAGPSGSQTSRLTATRAFFLVAGVGNVAGHSEKNMSIAKQS